MLFDDDGEVELFGYTFLMRSPRSRGTVVWEETVRISGLMWCSLEEWQTTKTALSGT